jgi:hypothetical protein
MDPYIAADIFQWRRGMKKVATAAHINAMPVSRLRRCCAGLNRSLVRLKYRIRHQS